MVTKKTSTGKTAPAKKAPAKKAPVKKAPAKKKVSIAAIRKRAEEIYIKRIEEGIPGDADSDWHQAEQELKK